MRLNDPAITVANFQNDLGEVIDAITTGGTLANNIVIGSPPFMTNYAAGGPQWNAGSPAKHATYVAACAAVAAAKGTKYADIYQAMVDGGGAALLAADGIHPIDAGHAVIAAAFDAAL